MGFTTKQILNNEKFTQTTGDTLTLSGNTEFKGDIFRITGSKPSTFGNAEMTLNFSHREQEFNEGAFYSNGYWFANSPYDSSGLPLTGLIIGYPFDHGDLGHSSLVNTDDVNFDYNGTYIKLTSAGQLYHNTYSGSATSLVYVGEREVISRASLTSAMVEFRLYVDSLNMYSRGEITAPFKLMNADSSTYETNFNGTNINDPLTDWTGSIYYDNVAEELRIFNGTQWNAISTSTSSGNFIATDDDSTLQTSIFIYGDNNNNGLSMQDLSYFNLVSQSSFEILNNGIGAAGGYNRIYASTYATSVGELLLESGAETGEVGIIRLKTNVTEPEDQDYAGIFLESERITIPNLAASSSQTYQLVINEFGLVRSQQISGGTSLLIWEEITGTSYTIDNDDLNKVLYPTSTASTTITIPTGLTEGFSCVLYKEDGSGDMFVVSDGTLISDSNILTIDKSSFTVLHRGNDEHVLLGGNVFTGSTNAYETIEDNGTPLTQRSTMNFVGGGIVAQDDVVNTRTNISLNTTLESLASYNQDGYLVQVSANTFVSRSIQGTTNKIVINNENGVSGDTSITIGSDVVDKTTSNTYVAGQKQNFGHDSTNAGLRLIGASGNPSSLEEGDMWLNLTTDDLYCFINNITISLTRNVIEEVTGTTYEFIEADRNKIKRFTHVSGCTATIPTGLSMNWSSSVYRGNGSGLLSIESDGTLESVGNTLNTSATMAFIHHRGSNIHLLVGAVGDAIAPHTLDSHTDVTISGITENEILKWNGSAWVNNTLQEAGIQKTVNQTKSLTLFNPTSSENISLFYTDVAITVTKIADAIQGSSPSITYQIHHASARNGSPNNLFSAGRTLTSAAGGTTTTFNDNTIPAGSFVWFTTSAASGTIGDVSITLCYSED